MTIDINAIDQIPVYETPEERPPYFFWLKGRKDAKTVGRFYIKSDQLTDAPAVPWLPSNQFDNEDGYEAPSLRIAIIAHRAQPYFEEEINGQRRRIWTAKWAEGAKIYTELLCFVEGISGACVWSMTGMVGRAVMGRSGIINQYERGLRKDLQRLYSRSFNPWALWLPIGPATKDKKPVYTATGFGSDFNMPALCLPEVKSPEDLTALINDLFVGTDLYFEGAQVYERYRGWLKERRGNEPPQAAEEQPGATYAGTPEESVPDDFSIPF